MYTYKSKLRHVLCAERARRAGECEDLRGKIVDAAIELLEQSGARGFGQVKVARAAGLQQGHLTYYFPRKADLVAAVLVRLSGRARDEFEQALAKGSEQPSEDLLFSLLRRLLSDRRRSLILLGLMAEAVDDVEIRRALAEQLQFQRRVFALLMQRNENDLDVHLAVAALRGLGIENLLIENSSEEVDALLERFRTWFARSR